MTDERKNEIFRAGCPIRDETIEAVKRDGIQMVEHIEASDGATVFAHACRLGLKGIVSKRRDRPYEHGRSRVWLKIKNPASRRCSGCGKTGERERPACRNEARPRARSDVRH